MPLPVTISGVLFPDHNYFCGPFKSSAGNVYVVLVDSTDLSLIEVWKATDPTSSFAEQDSADKPTLDANCEALWAYQVSDVLHIATSDGSTSTDIKYHAFNMATDNWDTVSQTIILNLDNGPGTALRNSVSISVRSDGDIIVLYNGDGDAIMGTDYTRVDCARSEAGVWTTGTAVDAAGETDWAGSVVVRGASDRMHFFYIDKIAAVAYHRSFDSANALDTAVSVDTTIVAAQRNWAPGVSYVSGANTVVKAAYIDSTAQLSSVRFNSGATPTVSVDANFSDNDISGSLPERSCYAVDGTTVHCLYSDVTSQDLFHDLQLDGGSFGTDTEELDVVTVNDISCNVYDRSGQKLAYVYDDGGTIKYNEVVLAVVNTWAPRPVFYNKLRKQGSLV